MNSLVTRLSKVPARDAGHATELVHAARQACLRASYHPAGGHGPKLVVPITHTVHLEGTSDQIASFLAQIGEVHEQPVT